MFVELVNNCNGEHIYYDDVKILFFNYKLDMFILCRTKSNILVNMRNSTIERIVNNGYNKDLKVTYITDDIELQEFRVNEVVYTFNYCLLVKGQYTQEIPYIIKIEDCKIENI